jgi:hypothetical protein
MQKPFALAAALSLALISAPARAERILIVGDSISCGPYGAQLIADLAEHGHSVQMYCSIGSAPTHWLKGRSAGWPCQMRTYQPKKVVRRDPAPHAEAVETTKCEGFPTFAQILARHPSDRVVVALGTNSLPATPGQPGKADASYGQMLQMIEGSGRSCAWIGPPHLQPAKVQKNRVGLTARERALNSFYDSLNQKLGVGRSKCSMIDSRDATAPGTPANETLDGIHPTGKAAAARYSNQAASLRRLISGPTAPESKAPGRANRVR